MKLSMMSALVRVSIAATKHRDGKASWEKRVYSAYASAAVFITEVRAGTQTEQGPGGRC